MGFLFADSQIGKSAALEEYQVRNNHGSTIYTEMPAGGGKVDYMIHLAEILKIGTGNRLRFPPGPLLRPFAPAGIGLEVMDLQAACRTYNILAAEGRKVAAALLFD